MADEEKLTDSNEEEEWKTVNSKKKKVLNISWKETLDIENVNVETEKNSPLVVITQPQERPPLLIS